MQIISNSTANIKLEITSEDLRHFSDELISRAVNEVAVALKATNEDKLLTREEVKEMCGVCDTTLWLWNKRNYLKAIKVGNKVRCIYLFTRPYSASRKRANSSIYPKATCINSHRAASFPITNRRAKCSTSRKRS